jgi:dethiobiotin synthetase
MSMSSCFVTGTDTGVGKTLVSAAIVRAWVRRGATAVGMKPVAAGAAWDGARMRNDDLDQLAAAGNVTVPAELRCPFLFEEAIAPHIAAARAGRRIDPARILRAYRALRERAEVVVVEGVGGFRVPLAPGYDTADLAREFALPVVLVVGVRLGCLNHAALTGEAIRARGLVLCGWVANVIDPRMSQVEANIEALARILPAPRLGRLPWLAPPDAASVDGELEAAAPRRDA